MNNDYPLAFVSWKGWLPPVPHFFVRIYPSHYYYYLNSLPVYDTKSYLDMGLKDGLKLVFKNIDRNALRRSMEAITGIKLNKAAQEAIEHFLRQSRLSNLGDVYQTSDLFYRAIQALNQLRQLNVTNEICQAFENDIRNYLEELILINRLDADQGDKLKAMAEINRAVQKLTGTIYYTSHKIRSYQQQSQTAAPNLSFLGRF
jgi:tetratricopeptide (TPR) repeat protein